MRLNYVHVYIYVLGVLSEAVYFVLQSDVTFEIVF
jgi:hypothetical protein